MVVMVRLPNRLRWHRPFRPGRNHAQRRGSVVDRGAWVIGAIVPIVLIIVAVSQVPLSPKTGMDADLAGVRVAPSGPMLGSVEWVQHKPWRGPEGHSGRLDTAVGWHLVAQVACVVGSGQSGPVRR